MTDAAIIYRTHVEAIENLPADQQLEAYRALIAYCMDDEIPENGIGGLVVGMAKPMLDKWKSRREAGAKGGASESNCEANGSNCEANCKQTEPKEKEKEKDIKEKTTDVVQKKSSRFSAPTVEQVQEYITEKGYSVDAERFVDFYASKGWKVGSSPMKDWKAAVRNWSRERKTEKPPNKNKFNNFEGRKYTADDYLNLERTVAGVENVL